MTPSWTRADMPKMPKGRYKIMTAYMPKVGTLGLDMMYRTCTVQTNLDFSSEADMVKKLRVSLALQPVATALFANSPFTEGKPNGFLSFRSEIWRDTDNARAGMLPWAFEPGMGFERWVDYALDVPMYFIKHGDEYVDVAGRSFRDLLAGKLPAMPGDARHHLGLGEPSQHDFSRGAAQALPGNARRRQRPLPTCWRCRPSGSAFFMTMFASTPRGIWSSTGPPRNARSFATTFRNRASPRWFAAAPCLRSQPTPSSSRAPASRAANISTSAARTRPAISKCSKIGSRGGTTPAEELLEKFHGPWGGSVDPIYTDEAY